MELEATKPATAIRRLSVVSLHRRLQTKPQNFVWLVLVGLSVSALYIIVLPYVERTWRTTGDEPHYLLAAHSLVHDFDFDLNNNYNQFDYLAFYFSKDIVRQVRYTAMGQEILDHHLGLPILIAPAYALGGRLGVLLFQAILAGVLAGVTFKLAWVVSKNGWAALVGTLFVFLSPPLFFYSYLVYPELSAALLTTTLLYFIITARFTRLSFVLIILSLVILPWFNRRFVPLTVVLALLTLWTCWQGRRRSAGLVKIGFLGVLLSLASIGLLWWFNSQLSTPTRLDITLPVTGGLLVTRLARGIGWLVDQQRGLFIFAPIYSVAVWSLPVLVRDFLGDRRSRNWLLILPFLLSLGLTVVAGGFWVAWELGPRFLVVALPALAPLLALAWQHYRQSKLFISLSIFFFALSLVNSVVILRHPELPYKSSLPLFYSEKLGLPLTDWLPNLGDYQTIYPGLTSDASAPVVRENDVSLWRTEAGGSAPIVTATPLNALSFGSYQLRWPVRVDPNLPSQTELLRLSIKHLGGGQVYYKTITAADLPADGSFGLIEETFFNHNPDRWRTAMVFQATSSGQSNLWAKAVQISPDTFSGWVLPYFYLALIVASGFGIWLHHKRAKMVPSPERPRSFALPSAYAWSVAVVIPIATLGYLIWQQNQPAHTYDAGTFQHFVGQPIVDFDAEDHRTWLVDPGVDPPQKAIYGPFDIYDAGHYEVAFRVKLPQAVDTKQEIAQLQVNATTNFDELATRSLFTTDFSKPGQYQNFTLSVDNPRRQALSFDVYYLGLAPLSIDQVTITETNP